MAANGPLSLSSRAAGVGVPVGRSQDSQSLTGVVRLCLLHTSAVWGPGGPGGPAASPGVQLYEFWGQGDGAPTCMGHGVWAGAPIPGLWVWLGRRRDTNLDPSRFSSLLGLIL